MATGDLTVTIRPDGWSADIYAEGFTSGATYAFGLATDNVPGTSTPYLTVVSEGYSSAGVLGTVTRTVYLTSKVRVPHSTSTQAGGTWALTFSDGETITCSVSGATAIVVGNQAGGTVLRYRNLSGTPLTTQTWTGGTSGATFVNTSSTVTTLAVSSVDEKVGAAGMTVRVSLSDWIFLDDNTGAGKSGTAPTITIPAAFITNSGGAAQTSVALTTAAVTQNSAAVYPKVVGNWTWPGMSLVTGDFKLRFAAFHGLSVVSSGAQSSKGKHNIACVVFTAADTSAHTATTTVTAPIYESDVGDAVPVVEFVGTMAVSTLTALEVLTCNAVAYPLIGDAGSILDTSAGTAQPTPLVGPITMINDKSNTYGVTCALVDPTGSDAGANTVYDTAVFNPSTAYKFLTIGKAAAAIAAYNNTNYSRNDVGGGIVYLNDGNYNWTGSANTYGAGNANTWITIKRATTSSARSAVVINGQSNNQSIRNKVKIEDLTFTSAATSTFSSQTHLWFHKVTISSTGTAPVYQSTVWYLTQCTATVYSAGFQQFSTENMSVALIRGCNFNTYVGIASIYTVIGNLKTDTSIMTFRQSSTAGPPSPVNAIFAFNRITTSPSGSESVSFVTSNTVGMALVQNILENTNNAQVLLSLAGDSNIVPMNNVILWHNTLSGQRINMAYNDSGTAAVNRLYWSVKNNLWEQCNIKSDTFTTANGNRIGNWSQLYGVNNSGNVDVEVTGANLGAGGSFMREFVGLKSYSPALNLAVQPVTSGTNAITYTAFVDRLSRTQAGSGAGNGNYRLGVTSPARAQQLELLVPYDISGVTRSTTDAAGAYHFGGRFVGFWF